MDGPDSSVRFTTDGKDIVRGNYPHYKAVCYPAIIGCRKTLARIVLLRRAIEAGLLHSIPLRPTASQQVKASK